jgi:glycosyltransferase involved in cell wall biosynthesis
MKIAYLGKIQLSDVDLSYLHEAQKLADITYVMEVCPRFLKGPAFNIDQIYQKSGIFKATDAYPEFQKYANFIDIDKFYVANTCGRLWQLKSFWTHFLLMLFLIRQQFNVIHLVWPPNIYEFIIYALRRKMILTVHDPFPHSGLDTFIVRLRRKVAFWLIPHFIILNKAQRKEFLNFYHLSGDRVFNSRLSCYTYLQTISMPNSSEINGRYILFAGKISPYKGLDYLLPAMEQVHQGCPDCRLIVAGGGKYHFDISHYQTLDYIDIRNRFIPDEELVTLIKHCAFMVCPYTDATQSGVIMSAFAFNKPVIATNVGGLPEMVIHQQYGLIIKEKNVNAIVESITLLWRQQDVINTYSEHIKQDYDTGELSWKKIAEEIRSKYATIIQ